MDNDFKRKLGPDSLKTIQNLFISLLEGGIMGGAEEEGVRIGNRLPAEHRGGKLQSHDLEITTWAETGVGYSTDCASQVTLDYLFLRPLFYVLAETFTFFQWCVSLLYTKNIINIIYVYIVFCFMAVWSFVLASNPCSVLCYFHNCIVFVFITRLYTWLRQIYPVTFKNILIFWLYYLFW